MNELNEVRSLQAARAGDEEAFQRLTNPYRHELLVHCYRILGSFEDAEDILQETLLRAWRRLNSFEGRAPLRAWLYKIATKANGGPAYAVYQRDETGVYRSSALHLLTLEHGQIAEINDFLVFDQRLFSRFGLPLVG